MKPILKISIAALALLAAAPLARAWTYNNEDVLLIFRQSGFNDVELNLGNVSQFTGKPNGYTTTVTNWDLNLVTSTFGADLSGVSVILAASTSDTSVTPAAWLSNGDPDAVPHDYLLPTWRNNLYSTISAVGLRPLTYLVPAAGPATYSIDPGGVYRLASYDYTVAGSGINSGAIPQFGGNVSFKVEQTIPGTFGFWQIQPSAVSPKPDSAFVGSFTINASGALTFTAGPLVVATPPTITKVTRVGTVTTVTFTTTVGGNYSLVYNNALSGPISTWPIVSGPVAGDGNNQSLNHTTSDNNGFYSVVRTP